MDGVNVGAGTDGHRRTFPHSPASIPTASSATNLP
eukprot:CAMPEP_0201588472 /NCGR_PEP_ID=MMETSP0190_2-20130828/155637_1 /ASSEMBLY_ACC=CAM_ASM_000263 /TAXON_ID=37353 /ORGANISM="Rosalina sp." /LENGTH=34 /DNA_ID= /DNA_START= /DNA_END= /DNA_ORIENTATION=